MTDPMDTSIARLKQQLQQLKELHDAGALPAAQYEESKAALERRILDLVLMDTTDVTQNVPPRSAMPSGSLLAAVAVSVALIAAGGYWWKGSPSQVRSAPTDAGASPAVEGANPPPARHQL